MSSSFDVDVVVGAFVIAVVNEVVVVVLEAAGTPKTSGTAVLSATSFEGLDLVLE
jgi:hypothetical protein